MFIFIIFFLTIILIGSSYYGVQALIQTTVEQYTVAYSQILTAACKAAIDKGYSNEGSSAEIGTIASDEETRWEMIDAFFNTLSINFSEMKVTDFATNEDGEMINQSILYKYVPVVLILDKDGFYTWYSEFEYDPSVGTEVLTGKMTTLTTWSDIITSGPDVYYLRYYMDNYVQVTKNDDETVYKGTVEEVYSSMGSPAALSQYIGTYEIYDSARDTYLARFVDDYIGYYINNENKQREWSGNNGSDYELFTPQISNGDWMEIVESPTVISFLQGFEIFDGGDKLNVYSYSASEYAENGTYYLTSDGLYHSADCPHLSDADKTRKYTSRRELAEMGYDPDHDCLGN